MKMAKFAPIVGFIVVLMLGGITFGQDTTKKAAEKVFSAAGGTADKNATKDPAKPAPAKGETVEKAGEKGDEKKAEGDEENKEGEEQPKGPGGLFGSKYTLPIMIGGFVLLWVVMGRKKKKQAAKRRELLTALKKGDRVMTIGGIIGTVAEAREQELVIKVDDGTRMKFARWAIRNTGDEVVEEKQKDEQEK